MEIWKISKAMEFIFQFTGRVGILPIFYKKSAKRFEVMSSPWYLLYFYTRLLFDASRIILTTFTFFRILFYDQTFDFSDVYSVLRFFLLLPVSIAAFLNIFVITLKREELVSTINTFLNFYDRFQCE